MGEFFTKATLGPQAPEYVRLTGALRRDPHWQVVYLDPTLGQAVFKRLR